MTHQKQIRPVKTLRGPGRARVGGLGHREEGLTVNDDTALENSEQITDENSAELPAADLEYSIAAAQLQELPVESPQEIPTSPHRVVRQGRTGPDPTGRTWLVRVVVETGGDDEVVVTAYRTSKIAKYWRSR